MRCLAVLAVVSAATLLGSSAHADDEPTKEPIPTATTTTTPTTPNVDQLFAEAMNLIADENYEAAIPKLEEAQRLDPGIGTQFNLATCYAKVGRPAIAWRNFSEVERLARVAGKKQRETAAKEMLAELRPRVPYLALTIDEPAAVTVRVDGDIVPSAEWAFIPVERGKHMIQVVAPSKRPFETTVEISEEGEREEVKVPPLASGQTRIEVMSSRRVAGSIFAGIGGVGLIAFAVTGVMILSAKSTADERCKPDCVTSTGAPDEEGNDAVRRGKTLLPINIVAAVAAVGGLTAGSIYLFTSIGKTQPPQAKKTTALSITPFGIRGVF